MVQVNVTHPYLKILPRDTFAILVDVVPEKGELLAPCQVTASNNDLNLDITKDIAVGTAKPNGEVRLQFGIAAFRSHSSYEPSTNEREFPIEIDVINNDGIVIAEAIFPLKMQML